MPTSIKEVVEKYPTIKFEGYAAWDEENPMKPPFSRQFINITGQKFNHLTVLDLFPFKDKDKRPLWIVECDCDAHTIFVVSGKRLRSGGTKSCGCAQVASVTARNLKHGFSYRKGRSRAYTIYHDMLRRCYNPERSYYKQYGGRGIKVCDEWLGEDGFINFYNWSIEHGYYEQDNKVVPRRELLSIERIDVNGNYCPENCKWIPLWKQSRNERNSYRFIIAGVSVTAGDLMEFFNVDGNFIWGKHVSGHWSDNEIIYAMVNQDKVNRAHATKSDRMLRDENGYMVLIPNYSDLDPWSTDEAIRTVARMYLPDNFINFLKDIKDEQ